MHARTLLRSSLLLLAFVFLAGCDGGGGSDAAATPPAAATQEIVVAPSLGKVVGGGAQAFDTDGNELSDEEDTGAAGFATLRIPASHSGPVLIRLRGKSGATYFDEATGDTEDFPEGQSFRAALPAPRASTGVSILTELAVRLAEASGQTLDADAIEAANERIRAALAPEVADLLTAPALVDATTGAGDLDGSDSGKLAARLGALARLASGNATPALTMLQQLAADVADGSIDGVDADGAAIMTVYSPASFAADFVRAVQAFAGAFGNADLQTASQDARAATALDGGAAGGDTGGSSGGDTGGSTGGSAGGDTGGSAGGDSSGFVTEPGTVSGALAGTYTLVYFDSDNTGGDPFANDETVEAVITAGGQLTLTGASVTIGPLSDPFLQSGPAGGAVNAAELIWEDATSGLIYGLSNNESGLFNEINIGDPSRPQANGFAGFVGQLTEEASGDQTEAAQAAAAFASLGTNSSSFRVVRSCTGADCPDTTAVGESVSIIVDERDGKVTFGSIVIDPAAEGYDYDEANELTGVEKRLQATVPDGAGGIFELRVYRAQFTSGGPPVSAVQLSRGSASVYVEYREDLRGGPVNTYFNSFQTDTQQPATLVYVVDDTSYNGKGTTLTSAPDGVSPLCRSFTVQGVAGPTTGPAVSDDFRPQFAWVTGHDRTDTGTALQRIDNFDARFSRVLTSPSTLSFNGGQFINANRVFGFEEGFLNPANGLVASARDRATSSASEIATACDGYFGLGGDVSLDRAGQVTISITDTASSTLIYERTFVFEAAGSLAWSDLLPSNLAYAITAAAAANGASPACAVTGSGATGMLTGAVLDADVSCAVPD